jgi:hypothetical protein
MVTTPACPALYPDWYVAVALVLVAMLIVIGTAIVAMVEWRRR